jgi:short-subunit dehydrogenase
VLVELTVTEQRSRPCSRCRLAATAADLRADGLDVDYVVHLDVTSSADWDRVVRSAVEWHGGLDVLVNNAGIIHVNQLPDETLEDWNALLAVNVTGVPLGMQAVIPALRARGGGSIVNISSILGLAGASGYMAYCASKAALVSYDEDGRPRTRRRRHPRQRRLPRPVWTAMNENEAGNGLVPLTHRSAGMEQVARYEGYLLMGSRVLNCTSRQSRVQLVLARPWCSCRTPAACGSSSRARASPGWDRWKTESTACGSSS